MTSSPALISAAEAVRRFRGGERPIIIDGSLDLAEARFDGDYRATSGHQAWLDEHLPTSAHIDLLTQWIDHDATYHFAAPRPAAFAAELGAAGIDGTRPIWLYDRTNLMWASRLWWTLRNAGIAATVIDGGLSAWKASGGPVTADGSPTSVAKVAGPTPQDRGLWVGRSAVETILSSGPGAPQLVCALSSDAMWGRVPTRYSRRGHIPGSLSLPARAVLGPTGKLLDGPDLTAATAGSLDLDRPIVVYCGGGISASLTGLALVHSGAADVRIYDGSLEEWSAAPELSLVSAS